jgi:hypothetical protein
MITNEGPQANRTKEIKDYIYILPRKPWVMMITCGIGSMEEENGSTKQNKGRREHM